MVRVLKNGALFQRVFVYFPERHAHIDVERLHTRIVNHIRATTTENKWILF